MVESKVMLELRKIRDKLSVRHSKMTFEERQKETMELLSKLERENKISNFGK
jgi:pyruvate kinase